MICAAAAFGNGIRRLVSVSDPLTLWLPAEAEALTNERRWELLLDTPRPRAFQLLITPLVESEPLTLRANWLGGARRAT